MNKRKNWFEIKLLENEYTLACILLTASVRLLLIVKVEEYAEATPTTTFNKN